MTADEASLSPNAARPVLLDLFCGAGGAAMGYYRAGFDVVGVDIKPQPRYPFEFYQADAMDLLAPDNLGTSICLPLWRVDAIHASPPCQHYSSATRDRDKHPDLYDQTRDALLKVSRPFVIENVIGAPYSHGIVLCGSMFGLQAEGEWVQRHRNFESSELMFQPACQHGDIRPITITGNSYVSALRQYEHSRQGTFRLAQRLMGIDWMTRDEMAESIPPAFTEYIGKQLMAVLR